MHSVHTLRGSLPLPLTDMHREALIQAGLVVSGTSPDERLVETIEIKKHPFFVGVQFHPEFKSRPNQSHPLFKGFISAVLEVSKGK